MRRAIRLIRLAVGRSLWGIVGLSLVTALGLYAGFAAPAAGFLFLLCVVVQAWRGDFWSAAIVATIGACAVAFFFTAPPFSFGVANPLDAIALVAFIIITFVITHLLVLYRAGDKFVIEEDEPGNSGSPEKSQLPSQRRFTALLRHASNAVAISVFLLLVYGLAWTYSTHRYLKGFAERHRSPGGRPRSENRGLADLVSPAARAD